jgi:hypothetical protein
MELIFESVGVEFCSLMYGFCEVNLLEHKMTPEIIVSFSRKLSFCHVLCT